MTCIKKSGGDKTKYTLSGLSSAIAVFTPADNRVTKSLLVERLVSKYAGNKSAGTKTTETSKILNVSNMRVTKKWN